MSVPPELERRLADRGAARAAQLALARPHLEAAAEELERGVEIVRAAHDAGVRLPLTEVARLLGVSRQTLHTRLGG